MNNCLKVKLHTVYMVALLVVFGGMSSYQVISAKQSNSVLLAKVTNSPNHSLEVDIPSEAPVRITEAASKVVSGIDFKSLTGADSKATSLFSFPEVKVKNTSDKVITSFSVILKIKETDRFFYVKPSQIKLAPNDSYVIKPKFWAGHLRQERIRAQGNKSYRPLDYFDSPELWIPARVSAGVLLVVHVTFSDGAEWKLRNK